MNVEEPHLFDLPGSAAAPARARVTDPDTSHQAAASVTAVPTKRNAVLAVLRARGPLTDEELAAAYNATDGVPAQSLSGLRTRRSELVAADLVVDTGQRRATAAGRAAVVWRARPRPSCPVCDVPFADHTEADDALCRAQARREERDGAA